MIANVRRLATSRSISASAEDAVGLCGSSATDSETGLTLQLYTTALLEHPVLQVGARAGGYQCRLSSGAARYGNPAACRSATAETVREIPAQRFASRRNLPDTTFAQYVQRSRKM